jgi:hypothetical protein
MDNTQTRHSALPFGDHHIREVELDLLDQIEVFKTLRGLRRGMVHKICHRVCGSKRKPPEFGFRRDGAEKETTSPFR